MNSKIEKGLIGAAVLGALVLLAPKAKQDEEFLNCVKNSLNKMKARVCVRGGGTGFLFVQRPFFVVDVQLSVPSVRLAPSLDDVQRAITCCLHSGQALQSRRNTRDLISIMFFLTKLIHTKNRRFFFLNSI